MDEKTTNLGNKPVVTTLADTQRVVLTDSSGALNSITGDNLRSYIQNGINPNLMYDNILIMYYDSDDWARMVHLDAWPALQEKGKLAIGVVITEGDKKLVVATQGTQLYWSSAQVTAGGKMTTSRREAIADWAGEANTAAQITHSECADVDYAPGYCANYSRVNSAGYGLKAGKWWLPSSGQLDMIWRHINGLNYALSLINDADQIPWEWHWSSTEDSASHAWHQSFASSYGYLSGSGKATGKSRVRPVSAYQ
jgi:hypothetical protein